VHWGVHYFRHASPDFKPSPHICSIFSVFLFFLWLITPFPFLLLPFFPSSLFPLCLPAFLSCISHDARGDGVPKLLALPSTIRDATNRWVGS
jgi:hypothetical protein